MFVQKSSFFQTVKFMFSRLVIGKVLIRRLCLPTGFETVSLKKKIKKKIRKKKKFS